MFNIDDIFRGYSNEDDYTARDLVLIELLIDKGVITVEEVNERYSHLSEKIDEVKKQRKEQNEKRLAELEAKRKELEAVVNDKSGC